MDQATIDISKIIGAGLSRRRISAQVPGIALSIPAADAPGALDPATRPQEEQSQALLAAAIAEGSLAWKVANYQAGRPDVIYTQEPINPQTGREVFAYLWMTPLAVMRHGEQLYSMYQAAVEDKRTRYPSIDGPLDRPQFEAELLRDTVPVAPQFAALVPADILAACQPIKTPKRSAAKAGKTPGGFAAKIGPRNSQKIIFNHARGKELTDQLEKWNVGPGTSLSSAPGWSDRGVEDPGLADGSYIERSVITSAGLDGLAWLQARGFAPKPQWYAHAMNMPDPDGLAAMDAILAAGVDPKAGLGDHANGSLWHAMFGPGSRSDHEMDIAGRVAWLKAQGVDWSQADINGQVPLARVLSKINYEMGMGDMFSSDGPLGAMGATLGMMVSKMGWGDSKAEEDSRQNNLRALSDLAVEMVESGVDPLRPALDGSTPWMSIYPDQVRATQRIAQQIPDDAPDKDGELMRRMMFGGVNTIRPDRHAYGKDMLEFIGRIEKAAAITLLDGDDANAAPGRRPRP